eukprot:scaffold114969_cov17-Tisochrysis_lutea.AAC.2
MEWNVGTVVVAGHSLQKTGELRCVHTCTHSLYTLMCAGIEMGRLVRDVHMHTRTCIHTNSLKRRAQGDCETVLSPVSEGLWGGDIELVAGINKFPYALYVCRRDYASDGHVSYIC